MRNLPSLARVLVARISAGSLLLVLVAIFQSPAIAQKTDTILFKNGNTLTVDIKAFERGQFRVSTIGMGTIYINWDVVDAIETDKTYQVRLSSGTRLLGSVRPGAATGEIVVQTNAGDQPIVFANVVAMDRVKIERSFWERIDGSVKLGMSYESSSKIGTVTLGANSEYIEDKYIVTANFNSSLTTGGASGDTRRGNFGMGYFRRLPDRWFWAVNGDLERNDNLGIDLRALAGAGAGRWFIQNNHSRLGASAGLAVSREFRANVENESQLEAQLLADYSLFFFTPTKTDINVSLGVYPGLTETDRVRGQFNTSIRWEIITDLFWDVTYFYGWDTKPPEGASGEDTGVNTSLGYTF